MQTSTRTVSALAILFSTLIGYAPDASAITIRSDRRYVYLYRTLAELADGQQSEAIQDASRILTQKLTHLFPSKAFDADSFDILANKQELIQSTIASVKGYLESLDSNRLGFRTTDLLPTAIIATFGARFSGAAFVGVAGSMSLGYVVMPLHVTRIDLTTGVNATYWNFDWTVVAMLHGGVGVGGGTPGAAGKMTVGMIFGPMNRAADFTGTTAAVSGTLALGAGMYVKAGAIANPRLPGRFNFPFVLFGASAGSTADAVAHGTMGYVFGPADVIRFGLSELSELFPKLGFQELAEKDLGGIVTAPAPPTEPITELKPETP